MDIEKELANALRAQDPGPEFTSAVLKQVDRPAQASLPARAMRPASRWRLPASLAASVMLATAGAWLLDGHLQQQRMAAAGEQLYLALAITSAQLNNVQQKISRNEDLEDGI